MNDKWIDGLPNELKDQMNNWVCSECGFSTYLESIYTSALCPSCEIEMYTDD